MSAMSQPADDKASWDSVISALRHAAIDCRDLADQAWQRTGERDALADDMAVAIERLLEIIDERKRP